MKLKLKNSHFR